MIITHKTKEVSLPIPSNKWHDANMFKWTASQIAVMTHTPTGCSAHDNPLPWKPVNTDGSPSRVNVFNITKTIIFNIIPIHYVLQLFTL